MTMYFADNKDIRDLLDSSRQRLTLDVLREFLLRRGIIVSDDATKEHLFDQISMWTLDLEDLNWLLDKTARADRTERYTSATVSGQFSDAEVRKAIESLNKNTVGPQLDSLTFSKSADGPFHLVATYSELDPAKTRLRQKRTRDGSIRLEMGSHGLSMRHEANERMSAVADELMKALAAGKKEPVEARKIDLSHLPSGESRTAFFLSLIRGVGGMKLSDVSKVQVERSMLDAGMGKDSPAIASSSFESEGADIEVEDAYGEHSAADLEEKVDLEFVGNEVRGAILRGASLLTSPEFQMLKKHFFLYGMEWTSEEDSEKGKIVQFEAAFENSQECSGFRYKVKGVVDRKKSGDGLEFVKTPRACTEIENSHYMKLLEQASRAALVAVEPKATEEAVDDSDEGDDFGVGCASATPDLEILEAGAPELSEVDTTSDEVSEDD
ncbi:hypothetical protein [Stenotrophomonas maltophilia]|uniref:hypothetical protein n=1 Tax=Stenotrophomonas maltophilia TaxID=40324 RepID=UPI000C153592|nr:hypothetical protein [Stenotrophomonas maltophilia]